MDKTLAWLWLADAVGSACQYAQELLELYPDPVELYDLLRTGSEAPPACLTPHALAQLRDTTPFDYEERLDHCLLSGIDVLTPDEGVYPDRLRDLPDLPLALYVTGDIACLNGRRYAGMVGTRRPSTYGRQAAFDLSLAMAQAGVVLVSGLADGLDSEAHRAAVAAGAPTVGVLGTAIDKTYPAINRRLRSEMEQGCGAVISEFAPGEATGAGGFLLRNRLIAALSDAVCVVEARQKSGTMNTVNHAKRYGRTVFAVPGAIFSPLCGGTNQLLDEGQAHAASSAAPILRHLGIEPAPQVACRRARPAAPTLSAEAKAMKKALTSQAQGLEPLAKAAGLSAGQALAALMELEVSGIAVSGAGGQYRRA